MVVSPPCMVHPLSGKDGTMAKVEGERVKVTINLPADLVKAAKITAIERDVDLQDLVADALLRHLARKGARDERDIHLPEGSAHLASHGLLELRARTDSGRERASRQRSRAIRHQARAGRDECHRRTPQGANAERRDGPRAGWAPAPGAPGLARPPGASGRDPRGHRALLSLTLASLVLSVSTRRWSAAR